MIFNLVNHQGLPLKLKSIFVITLKCSTPLNTWRSIQSVRSWVLFSTLGYSWLRLSTLGYFWGTFGYFLVLFGTFWYFVVLFGTFWFFGALLGTFGYFWILLDTFGYFFCTTSVHMMSYSHSEQCRFLAS